MRIFIKGGWESWQRRGGTGIVLGLALGLVAGERAMAAERRFQFGDAEVRLEERTGEVAVLFSGMRLNPARQEWNLEVVLSNRTDRPITGPVVLAVLGVRGTSGLRQPDGFESGDPSVAALDLTAQLDGARLAAHGRSRPRTVALGFVGTSPVPELTTAVFGPVARTTALGFVQTLDAAGQPLGAVVIHQKLAGIETITRSDRRFGVASLGGEPGEAVWQFQRDGFLPVWRRGVLVDGEVSPVPAPRLVRRDLRVVQVPSSGGVVDQDGGAVRLVLPAGPLAVRVTSLTGQTLPGFLPRGWSPLQACWIEVDGGGALGGGAQLTLRPWGRIEANEAAVLARWDEAECQWVVAGMAPGNGEAAVQFSLGVAGAYALVAADRGSETPLAPRVDDPLPAFPISGEPLVLLASGAVSPSANPASLDPALVTAQGSLTITDATGRALVSGLIVESDLADRYELSRGSVRTPPSYRQSLVAYQRPGDTDPATLQATFPLRPLLLIDGDELARGTVQARVFAPASFTGGVLDEAGGVVTDGALRLWAPAGTLAQPVVVELRELDRTNFTALSGGAGEVVAAFQLALPELPTGRSLGLQWAGAPSEAELVLARVHYQGGQVGLEPVERLRSDANGRIASVEPLQGPALPRLDGAGQFVLVRVPTRLGLVRGTVRDRTGGAASDQSVEIEGWPWRTQTATDGTYRLIAPAGDLRLVVTDRLTGDRVARVGQLSDPLTGVELAVDWGGTGLEILSVSPLNLATNVPLVSSIAVTFSKPIRPATALGDGVTLRGTDGTLVPASVVLNLRGTTVTLLPLSPLDPGVEHVLSVSPNVTDLSGEPLGTPYVTRFTTVPPALGRSAGAQLIAFEPTNGVMRIVGSQGLADPNARVVLVNETTSRVTTVLAHPDGSFTGELAAEVDDRISATLINANGSTNTVALSRQIYADGSVALFSAGGTLEVSGEHGPIQLHIEPGAIGTKTKFKAESIPLSTVTNLLGGIQPEGEGRVLGGIRLAAIQGSALTRSIDVEFPVDLSALPLPEGVSPTNCTFGLALARVVDGEQVFELVDRMHYEDGKLVTHSPPFFGLLGLFEDVLVMPLLMAVAEIELTVHGKVFAAQWDPVRQAPILGTEEYVADAIVTARPASSGAGGLRGRLRPGAVFTSSGPDGSYALLVRTRPLDPTHAVGISATHPKYPRVVADTRLPELDPGTRLAIGNVLTPHHVVFPKYAVGRRAPPELAVSHAPERPDPGTSAVVTILASDNDSQPSVAVEIEQLVSLVPNVPVSAGDAQFEFLSTDTVSPQVVRTRLAVMCKKAAQVLLRIRAHDQDLNGRETLYGIAFGGADPVVPNEIPAADANDRNGPFVLNTHPSRGSRGLSVGAPIQVQFNEPIDRSVLANPRWVQLAPPAGIPRLDLSADQTELLAYFPGLKPDTEYTLTLNAAIHDLSGNRLDQDPTEPGDQSFSVTFRTAPWLRTELPVADASGAGAVIAGGYGFVLQRQGTGRGTLQVFNLGNPSAPVLAAAYTLPPFPRDLLLIPQYSFVYTNGTEREVTLAYLTNGAPVITRDLLAVIGGLVGAGQAQYLRVFDVSDPLNARIVASYAISVSGMSAATRLRWDAPRLGYLETASPDVVNLVNLQTLILGELLPQKEYLLLPADGRDGVDLNGDGDYVDAGEAIPLPGRLAYDFAGKELALTVSDTTQGMVDFVLENGGEYVGVALGEGVVRGSNGLPTTEIAAPAFRTLMSGGLRLPREAASYVFTNGTPKRLLSLFSYPVVVSNLVARLDLVLVSVRGREPDPNNYLDVLDVTDRLAPRLFTEIALPRSDGNRGIWSPILRDDGLILVASDTNTFVLDPARFSEPRRDGGPHPAWMGTLVGLGGSARSFGASAAGLTLSADVEGKAVLLQTAPVLEFASFAAPAVVRPWELATQPESAVAEVLGQISLTSLFLPSQGATPAAGRSSSLSPPAPSTHYHVLVHAPGGAGPTLDLALENLDWAGAALRKRGFLFPPVHALSTTVARAIGEEPGTNDPPVRTSRAWRLSANPASPYYNLYLSRPFAVIAEEITRTRLSELQGELDRDILWAGHSLRASLDATLQGDPVLGRFAGTVDPDDHRYRPGAEAVALAIPGDYLQSPNPGPVSGTLALPFMLNAVSAHNGELIINDVDLRLPGRRLPIEFRRNYSGQGLHEGPFGRGWDFNFNQRLTDLARLPAGFELPQGDPDAPDHDRGRRGDLLFYTGAGRVITYRYSGTTPPDGVAADPLVQSKGWFPKIARYYLPPAGLFSLFFQFKDGRYLRLEPDGTEHWYNHFGRLERIYDRYDRNQVELVYNGRGDLIRITDELRRPLDVGYYRLATDPSRRFGVDEATTQTGAIGKIARLLDYTGRDVRFYYTDDGLLERRESPRVDTAHPGGFTGRQVTRYAYSGSTEPAKTGRSLVSVRSDSHAGASFLNVAEQSDRGRDTVKVLELASPIGGPPARLSLNQTHANRASAMLAAGGAIDATAADGSALSARFDALGRMTNASYVTGTGDPVVNRTEYYPNGLVRATITPGGMRTEFTYDPENPVLRARGNVRRVTKISKAAGDPVLEATSEFDPWYQLRAGVSTDFNGNPTTTVLTADHRDTQTVTRAGEREIFTVNEFGQVETHTSIDGIVRRTTYTADGFLASEAVGELVTTYDYTPAATGYSDPTRRGLPSAIVDPNGVRTELTNDELDRLITERRGALVRRSVFDAAGNLVRSETAVDSDQWLVEERAYNAFGLLTTNRIQAIETRGGTNDLVTVFIPDALNRVREIITPSGAHHQVAYDALGRLTNYTVAGLTSESYTFDPDGNQLTRTVGTATEHYAYDGFNRLARVTSPAGGVTELTLDGNNNLLHRVLKDAGNQVLADISFTYDALNRLRTVTRQRDQGVAVLRRDFDTGGRTATTTDALGNRGRVAYDPSGRPIRQELPNRTIDLALDGNQNVTNRTVTELLGRFTEHQAYNALNQRVSVTDNAGFTGTVVPRFDGAVVAKTDREGHATHIAYTKLAEPTLNTAPNGVTLAQDYDELRRNILVRDAAGHQLEQVYDVHGRLISAKLPNGQETRFLDFNEFMQPRRIELPRGIVVQLNYDLEGKLTNRVLTSPHGSRQETYTYDAAQRPLRQADPSSSVTQRYDLGGFAKQLDWEYQFQAGNPSPPPLTFAIRQAANAGNFRTNLVYPGGSLPVTELRDPSGRLIGLVPADADPVIESVGYGGDQAITNLVLGSKILRLQQEFDPLQRVVTRRYLRAADDAAVVDLRYAYDRNGAQLARQYVHAAGRLDLYRYDPGYRLARADLSVRPALATRDSGRPFPGFTPPASLGLDLRPGRYARVMNYDDTDALVGNQLINPDGLPVPPMVAAFAGFSPLLFPATADGFNRQADEVGNVTRTRLAVAIPGQPLPELVGATLTYNELGQLVQVSRDDGVTVLNEYNLAGLRIRRRVSGSPTRCVPSDLAFIYDRGRLIEERDLTAGAAVHARYYSSDDGDELLAADLATGPGGQLQRHYLLTDLQKSVVALADATGRIVERTVYDAWGQATRQLPDAAPPRIAQVQYRDNTLNIVFTETALPAFSALASTRGFVTSYRALGDAFRVTAGANSISGTWEYDEAEAGAPFGAAYRFIPDGQLPGAVGLALDGGAVQDEWGNTNAAVVLALQLPSSGTAVVYTDPAGGTTEPAVAARSVVGLPFAFHGQYFDADAGLLYCRMRYYDPYSGSFLQRDPSGYADSPNAYAAFRHNPVNYRDPTGNAVAADAGAYLTDLGNQASIKEDGLAGYLVGRGLVAVGTVLQLGTSAAEGAELLESQRPGTLGLMDRLKGADLVINDAQVALGAAGTLAGLGATVAGKAHGYLAARQERQASRQFLRKRGLASFESTGFFNGMEAFRREMGANSVEVGIRSFGEKAQARREAVEAGYRQKPISVKDKTGADAIVHKNYALEPEYHGAQPLGPRQSRVDYVSDTDLYHVKIDGRPATKEEVARLRLHVNREQARAYFREGMTGVPNVGVMHGAHLNQHQELGIRLDGDRMKPFSVEDMKKIGHPGEGFAIRVGGGGRVQTFELPHSYVQSMMDAVDSQMRQAVGRGLPDSWHRYRGERPSALDDIRTLMLSTE